MLYHYFGDKEGHTLSTIFARDLTSPEHMARWEEHIVATTLASVGA